MMTRKSIFESLSTGSWKNNFCYFLHSCFKRKFFMVPVRTLKGVSVKSKYPFCVTLQMVFVLKQQHYTLRPTKVNLGLLLNY